MSGDDPLRIDGDPASCSSLGGTLVSAAARLEGLDALPELRADLHMLGEALQRYSARLVDVTQEARAVEEGLDAAGLMLHGRRVVPGWGVRDPDVPHSSEELIPRHTEAVRHVARRTSRARRRLQIAAESVSAETGRDGLMR